MQTNKKCWKRLTKAQEICPDGSSLSVRVQEKLPEYYYPYVQDHKPYTQSTTEMS